MVEPERRHALSVRDLRRRFLPGRRRGARGRRRQPRPSSPAACSASSARAAAARASPRAPSCASSTGPAGSSSGESCSIRARRQQHGSGGAATRQARAMRAIRGGEIGLIFQEPMSRAQRPLHRRQPDHRGDPRCTRDLSKAAARERAIELLDEVGIPRPEQRIDAYPFQLSRRPAPARRDRAGAGRRSATS